MAPRRPTSAPKATLAGKEFNFALADALKKGPVGRISTRRRFTPGCTVEAHEFAEATAKFTALGATVIGVSHDPIEKLDRFSVSECRSKFAVASDADGGIRESLRRRARASTGLCEPHLVHVIAPTGEIIYSYTAMDPEKHVGNTMAAVQKWQDAHKKS